MYRQWRLAVELEHGFPNKKIRSDNGGEYTSTEFEEYLANAGKQHDTSVPDTPEQNGVAERANRTLVETARCMLNDAGLPKKYWAEAVNTAVHLRNSSPTVAVTGVTPYEALYGVKPQVSALKVFGATGYARTNGVNGTSSHVRLCFLVMLIIPRVTGVLIQQQVKSSLLEISFSMSRLQPQVMCLQPQQMCLKPQMTCLQMYQMKKMMSLSRLTAM